ncbi:cyclic nucleotide-gated cation channel beta-1-like protein, partial [Lates japonicus]
EPQKNRQVKSPPLKNTDEASEDSQGQTGVLGWLSNGFVSALPQPSNSPRLNRANSEARSGEDEERSGVIGWVTQGLTKVLPQPDEKYRETNDNNNEEHTEVYDVATMPDFDPLPHIPVVEMVSDDESEVESLTPQFPPNMVNWIKQMIPQPVILPPGAVLIEPSTKSSRSSLDKILSPPPESLSGISLDTDSKASGVVGWFVSGLGLKMPQPAIPPKDDAICAAEVLQKASSKLKPDMVLEDVESDNEGQQKCEDHSKAAAQSTSLTPPSPTTYQQQEAIQQTQPNSLQSDANPQSVTKTFQEDAETQTGRWTPFIESIKREAEDVALATMEERSGISQNTSTLPGFSGVTKYFPPCPEFAKKFSDQTHHGSQEILPQTLTASPARFQLPISSSPNGSTLGLPNVPIPIAPAANLINPIKGSSTPCPASSSCLSNPSILHEDDSNNSAIRP